jgi:hypothetical protein
LPLITKNYWAGQVVAISDHDLFTDPYIGESQATLFSNVVDSAIVQRDRPVIILLGEPIVTVVLDSAYKDAGVTAHDRKDGDLTSAVIVGGSVDSSTPGLYLLTYDVTDSDGNAAKQILRTVYVTDGVGNGDSDGNGGGDEGGESGGNNSVNNGGNGGGGNFAFVLLMVLLLILRIRRYKLGG